MSVKDRSLFGHAFMPLNSTSRMPGEWEPVNRCTSLCPKGGIITSQLEGGRDGLGVLGLTERGSNAQQLSVGAKPRGSAGVVQTLG